MDPNLTEAAEVPEVSEDNLSELLDSCLDDFNKPLPTNTASIPKKSNTKPTDESANWSEEFKQFNDVMGNIMGDELGEIRKLMEGCVTSEGLPMDEGKFAESFAETLRELTQQAQNVPDTSPEDVANLLSTLDMGEDSPGDIPEIMPFMQNLMQKLMSKELLYPSIKEIVDKYPEWLNQKKDSLKTEEYDKYCQQHELMKEICEEFEREGVETNEEKNQQFEKVLPLMQKVQGYGNPPKELVANIGPCVPLDDQGNLNIPGMPQQCSIM